MADVNERPACGDLLDCYIDSLRDAGMYVGSPVVSVARTFFGRIGPDGWSAMSLDEQCDLASKYRRVVGWLMATGRLRATSVYLVRVPAYLGGISSRLNPEMFAAFSSCGSDLGFDQKNVVQQWSAVAKAAALHCCMPDQLCADQLEHSRDDLLTAQLAERRTTVSVHAALSRDFFQAGSTLFHAGMLDRVPPRRRNNNPSIREQQWATTTAQQQPEHPRTAMGHRDTATTAHDVRLRRADANLVAALHRRLHRLDAARVRRLPS